MLTAFMLEAKAKARRRVCDDCPEKRSSFGVDLCGKCGCVLTFKTKLTDADCPLNKWNTNVPPTQS